MRWAWYKWSWVNLNSQGSPEGREWFSFGRRKGGWGLETFRYFSTLPLASVRNSDFKEDCIFTYTILLEKRQTKFLVYFQLIKNFIWFILSNWVSFLAKFLGREPGELLCLFIFTESSRPRVYSWKGCLINLSAALYSTQWNYSIVTYWLSFTSFSSVSITQNAIIRLTLFNIIREIQKSRTTGDLLGNLRFVLSFLHEKIMLHACKRGLGILMAEMTEDNEVLQKVKF